MGKEIEKRPKATLEECAEALRKSGGFLTGAARLLKQSPAALCSRIARHPELKEVQNEAREEYLDLAESALIEKIRALDLGAICFFLKCQGKSRGYIERQDIHQNVDAKLEVTWQK